MAPAPKLLDSSTELVALDAAVEFCIMKLGNHLEIAGEETESWPGSENVNEIARQLGKSSHYFSKHIFCYAWTGLGSDIKIEF